MAPQTKHNLNDSKAGITPTNPPANLNASLTRKVGSYRLVLDVDSHGTATCIAYRNDRAVTRVRAASHSTALTEARRNVRNARKAGGL